MGSGMWGLIAQVGVLLIKGFVTDQANKARAQKSWEEWVLYAQSRTALSAQTRTSYQNQLSELKAKRAAAEVPAQATEKKST